MGIEINKILSEKYPEFRLLDDEEAQDNFWEELSEREKYEVNKEYLLQIGDPEYDYLVCWEPGRLDEDKKSFFDYPTFYDFDKDWWEFQKQAIWGSIEDQKKWMESGKPGWTPEKVANAINDFNDKYAEYSIYCSGDWFRLIDDDKFIYSQVISAKWYVYYQLEILVDDMLDTSIPWSFKGDKDNWLNAINATTPEDSYDAGGREVELDTMKSMVRKYQNLDLFEKIDEALKQHDFSGKTFRVDRGYEEEGFDPFTDFIFYDEQSLKNVRTTNFLEDFKANQLDYSYLENIIEDLKKIVAEDFARMYDENRSRYI